MQKTPTISFINGAPWLDELKAHLPYEFTDEDPDLILSWSVSQMGKTWEQVYKYPQAKLVAYNWDIYDWVFTRPRPGEYDYRRYIELLLRADEVWVPSHAECKRTMKLVGFTPVIVPTFVPVFDAPVGDGGYVLNPLRQLPDDHDGWFEKACGELNIPCVTSSHQTDYEEYKKVVANCRFLCSPYRETSTGGLDLMKGYHLGKPSLVWHESGARTYLGDDAVYFTSYEDLVEKLKEMYELPPKFTKKRSFSIEQMCGIIEDRVGGLLNAN